MSRYLRLLGVEMGGVDRDFLDRLVDTEALVIAIVSEFGMPGSITRDVIEQVPMTGEPYR